MTLRKLGTYIVATLSLPIWLPIAVLVGIASAFASPKMCRKESDGYNCKHRTGECGNDVTI